MPYKTIYHSSRTTSNFWTGTSYLAFYSLFLSVMLFSLPGGTEETKTNPLPQSPDTDTPEEDFSGDRRKVFSQIKPF